MTEDAKGLPFYHILLFYSVSGRSRICRGVKVLFVNINLGSCLDSFR